MSSKCSKHQKEKSTADFVMISCIVGIVILVITCLTCIVSGIIVAIKSSGDSGESTIPMIGVVLSIWVGLNIYNVISNKEIQLIHVQSEKANKQIEEANKQIEEANEKIEAANKQIREANAKAGAANERIEKANKRIGEANDKAGAANEKIEAANEGIKAVNLELDKAKNEIANNDERQKKNILTALLSTISDSMEFYSFTSLLLRSFQDVTILETTPRPVMDLLYRVENTFSAAAKLNRSHSYDERIDLAKKGLEYCDECIDVLKSDTITNQEANDFVNAYLNLRKGDFHFYKGYRIKSKAGVSELNEAIKCYQQVENGIYRLCEAQNNCILNIGSQDNEARVNEAINDIIKVYDEQGNTGKEEILSMILMRAYIHNIIGECYNVRLQYKDTATGRDQVLNDALGYFKTVYQIYEVLREIKESDSKGFIIPRAFAKYLRNYGTALEKDKKSQNPGDMYIEALSVDKNDTLSYRTYSFYKIKMMQKSYDESGTLPESEELLYIIDFLDVYIACDPTFETAHYIKGVACLLLAVVKNDDETKRNKVIDEACRQFRIARRINTKFKFDAAESTIDIIKKSYPDIAEYVIRECPFLRVKEIK